MQEPTEQQQHERELELMESRRSAERRAAQQQHSETNDQAMPLPAEPPEIIILRHNGDAGDTQKVVEVLARRLIMRLFSVEDRAHFLDDATGKLIPISAAILRALVAQHLCGLALVERGAGRFQAERCAIELSQQTVLDVLAGLSARVAKVTMARALSPQLCSEAVSRIRMGEARAMVAKVYFGEANSTTLAELKRIEEAAGPRW